MNAGTQSARYRNAWRCAIRKIDTNCGRKCFRRLCFISWHASVSHSISVYASPRTHYFTTRISTYVSAWLSNHVIIYVVNLQMELSPIWFTNLPRIMFNWSADSILENMLNWFADSILKNTLNWFADNTDFQEIHMCFFSFYVASYCFLSLCITISYTFNQSDLNQ